MDNIIVSKLNYPQIGMLVFSWFIGLLVFPWLISFGRRIGAVDRPQACAGSRASSEYKAHVQPTPFLGGVGIFIAFSITVLSTLKFSDVSMGFEQLMGLLVGGFFIMALGLVDDFRPINAVFKLLVLFVGTFILYYFGIRLSLFPDGRTHFEVFNIILTLLWIVGVTSAFNSLDNMDGASGGTAAVAAIFVFIIAWGTSPETAQPWLSFAAIALVGSALAFLRYNWSPARIFLGDNGSFLIGFLLAAILIMGGWSTSRIKSIIIPCMILTVPLYDITLSTILRLRHRVVKGLNPLSTVKKCILYCGRDHTTHRLMALGLSKKQTAAFLYFLGVFGGGLALLVKYLENPLHVTFIVLVYFFALLFLAMRLDKAHVYEDIVKK
jgi:UDP-GlcNAc:undecaprenyl-phosphate GlcNAc-1-phosphate transferase